MNANKEKAKELFAKAFALDPAFQPTWGGNADPAGDLRSRRPQEI